MKIKELLNKINKVLKPYKDFTVDEDWEKEIDGKSLYGALQDCFEETDLVIIYWWDYDD